MFWRPPYTLTASTFILMYVTIGWSPAPEPPQRADELQNSDWPRVTLAAVEELRIRLPADAIDPVPVEIPGGFRPPDQWAYRQNVQEQSEWLRTRLRRHDQELFQALPFREGCDGHFVPPQSKQTTGCPSELWRGIILDVPRSVDAKRWLLRMAEITYEPRGRMITTYEIELSGADGSYKIEAMRPLVVYE